MWLTLAVMFIVLATFVMILVNMFNDYKARRDQDLKAMNNHAKNIIADTEDLLLNQTQISMSKILMLILHYRILRCLNKMASVNDQDDELNNRINNEKRLIEDIKKNYHDELAFRPPETDAIALGQLRVIRRLRAILRSELRVGSQVTPSYIQKEDRRLYLLVLKVNISNLIQRTLELRKLKQFGSCRLLVQKGMEVIQKSNLKDDWLNEKADLLNQLSVGLDAEKAQRKSELEKANRKRYEEEKDMNEIFGDKKKW